MTSLEYKIVTKPQFTVMGVSRRFNVDTSQSEIPKFWQEHMSSVAVKDICGTYGICYDEGTKDFAYMIADDYIPSKDLPSGAEAMVVSAGTWAVFPCRGALPASIQKVTNRVFNEWLPSQKKYKQARSFSIEYYTPPCPDVNDDYCEIWLPVEVVD